MTDAGAEMAVEVLRAILRVYGEVIGPRVAHGIARQAAAPVLEQRRPELEGSPVWNAVVAALRE